MSNKIKILHVTFDMAIGGTEQVIRQLVENTDRERYEVSILCIDNHIGEIGQQLKKDGIAVFQLKRLPQFDFELVKALRRLCHEKEIDILHCHQYTPYFYGVLAAIRTDMKVIFTEHGRFYPDRSSWKRKLLNPLLVKLTDQVTSISKATKEALIRFESIPEHRIQVIYNGIADLSQKKFVAEPLNKELGIDDNSLILGTISRLDPIKNHKMMISAFKEIQTHHANTRLLIVGDGPLRHELEQQCQELGLENQVIFTGFKVEPQKYLSLMDIFLLPSFSEGTSMTLLEAMSFSKPCVVTDVGGNPEIVVDRLNGLVIPNDDKDKLVAACLDLIENTSEQKQLGVNGRKRFDEHFTVQKMMLQFDSLYASLTS